VSKHERDYVHRRIVCEYGNHYVYIYMTDQNGKVLEEEAFKQPFRLELKEVDEEAREFFQQGYQWLQDTVLWYSTARDDNEKPDSEETTEQ
jgi:hypothetical protein